MIVIDDFIRDQKLLGLIENKQVLLPESMGSGDRIAT